MGTQMENSFSGQSTSKNNDELTSLSKAQHDLNICQKKNRSLQNELKMWKGRTIKAEESLKKEQRNSQKNITQLGFKMLQFENELRKEQREIEHKFLEKDQQIKILQDVINSLHSKMKTNSLCYNCFMTKHITQEQSISQDNYVAKFPLDMDFHDHKNVGHPGHETRNRNISLPLSMPSPHESPRANGEFCFHHMLSPVPEELENSFAEHARKENLSMAILEEEEGEEEENEAQEERNEAQEERNEAQEERNEAQEERNEAQEERNEAQEERNETQQTRNEVTEQGNRIEVDEKNVNEELVRDMTMDSVSSEEMGKIVVSDVYESRMSEEAGESMTTEVEVPAEFSPKTSVVPYSQESFLDEDMAGQLKNEITQEEAQYFNKDDNFGCPTSKDNLAFDIKLLLEDLISRIEFIQENKDSGAFDSTQNIPSNTESVSVNQELFEEKFGQQSVDRMALSPKSEALVAEIKKAIVEASMEVEKSMDNPVTDGTFDTNCSSDGQGDTSLVAIEDIDIEMSSNSNVTCEVNNAVPMMTGVSTNSDNCQDALTDYDVIELD